ncbi:MAG: hypothetical protein KJO82_08035 [Gammaproteobacteria bacterium]|nr:hypothetical protein [Gammaproteobacteria bacterium]
MKFLLYLGIAIASVVLFFSGSLPYTLIYDQKSLQGLKYSSEEPITADVIECEIDDKKSYVRGATFETSFEAKLRNHTNRFVVVSSIGEVFDPSGNSMGMKSQVFVLNPNSSDGTRYMTKSPFTTNGRYSCEMRYTIGRFEN